ncbi:hypothetical protein D5086_013614 [Populus alba]|uniref:Uncharacterized protein n=1 Tax=Populus alba TaxID=43335 RepID=A0ACC4C685_POPAL
MAFRLELVLFALLLSLVVDSVHSDDGATLLEIKKSFRDVDNVLYDWTDSPSSDYCVWRGVICDNVTYNVLALNLSGLNLEGEISPAIGNLKDLTSVDLKGNRLSGQIPDEIGDCSSLQDFDVKNNSLTGKIPENIGNCTSFQVLDLSFNQLTGEIPFNIGFLQIATLSLQGNQLTGKIPPVIGLMQALAVLDLSCNMLSGPIPPILGNLTYTEKLELNDNQLTGNIPPELGKLTDLYDLDISNNKISGSIPSSLGYLEHILKLDLSYNHLSGLIPQELSQIQNMFLLNVSYNNLAGVIPTSNNFSRFSPDSFVGNPGLCGYWLNSPCHDSHPAERATISKAAILGIALGALVILLMILVAACRPHNPAPFPDGSLDKPVSYSTPKLVILHMNMALHVYEDIMRMTENLSEKYIIGHGASSTVYKCVLKNCRPVAIKRLYSHYPQCLKEFETELETVGSIKHRNLVSLQGYSLSPSGNLLFYDYMENGSLWDHFHGPMKKKKLDWDTRLRIALGAAQGLAYLHHDCSPRIIHRDVKSSNILLDKDFEAHLTDFGIAKRLCVSKSHTSTYIMGTIGYIDPEYARTSRLTEKSDVYSYGIVLLELLTGRKAVDNECNLHHLILSKTANNEVMETVDPEITATCKDLGAVKKVFQLALLCTKRQPTDRPTMHEVTRVLGSLVPLITPPKQCTQAPPAPLPSAKVPCYIDEYANIKSPHILNCPSMSTSDAQLFLKFGEVISQNSQ